MWKTGVVFVALMACALGASINQQVDLPDAKIVGGSLAQLGQFPYLVSLQIIAEKRHYCGASILSANYVLTAAHCVTGVSPTIFQVVAGELEFDVQEGTEQTRRVASGVVHPNYVPGTGVPNDIAVLQLESPLTLNAYVQPISLPNAGIISSGYADVAGWGSISTTSSVVNPRKLYWVNVPILDYSVCQIATGGEGNLAQTNICTGPLSGGKGFCAGDSGGPLAQGNVQVGIVSWNFTPCGVAGKPFVYTRVSAFVDWIKANTDL